MTRKSPLFEGREFFSIDEDKKSKLAETKVPADASNKDANFGANPSTEGANFAVRLQLKKLQLKEVPSETVTHQHENKVNFKAKSSSQGAQNEVGAGQYDEKQVIFKEDDKNSMLDETKVPAATSKEEVEKKGGADQHEDKREDGTIQPAANQEMDEDTANLIQDPVLEVATGVDIVAEIQAAMNDLDHVAVEYATKVKPPQIKKFK